MTLPINLKPDCLTNMAKREIPHVHDAGAPFSEFAFIGLLKTAKCLFQELDDFRRNLSGSATENSLWEQCEKRFQEIETYQDMLPEEICALVMMHASRSHALKREKRRELNGRQR